MSGSKASCPAKPAALASRLKVLTASSLDRLPGAVLVSIVALSRGIVISAFDGSLTSSTSSLAQVRSAALLRTFPAQKSRRKSSTACSTVVTEI